MKKIPFEEIHAACAEYVKETGDGARLELIERILEAAYRVRKARKKAKRDAKPPSAADTSGIMAAVTVHGVFGEDAFPQSKMRTGKTSEYDEREAALRKLGSAIAREFPGVSG